MKITKIMEILDAEMLCGEHLKDTEIITACGCDLMSDVLAFVKEQCALITGLVNPQSIRTAMMMDMKCVIFVRGKRPDEKVVALANEHEIAILSSTYTMFDACGRLFENGMRGGGKV